MKKLNSLFKRTSKIEKSGLNLILIILPILVIFIPFTLYRWHAQRRVMGGITLWSFFNVSLFISSLLVFAVLLSISILLIKILSVNKIINLEKYRAQTTKDELLSLTSHQLRTPATAVKQYLGMILQGYAGKVSDEQLKIIENAYKSNERQLETINQILYVAKADAGRLELQCTYFNLNQLIEEVLNDISSTLKEKRQRVEFKPKYVNMTIYADKHCIRMVIENLLSNASKYSHRGGKIIITTTKKSNVAIFSVIDNGVGIDFEDRNKLFKKFSRIDNELSIQAGGSGIGLYLDKLLVEMHSGHIRVVSQPKKGTSFIVHIPLMMPKARLGAV